MGNAALGAVLPGQPQGVTAGPGLTIDPNGSITINSQTTVGLMKLGQTAPLAAAAFNSYDWPVSSGTAGQQLTIASLGGGVTTLTWGDPGVLTWSGGTTGLTPVTPVSGAVVLGGVLGVANGGTGQTTAAGSINNLLPSQTGKTGEVLSTNGTNVSWTPVVSSIVAGTNITISPVSGTGAVTINATGGGGGSGTVTSVDVSGGSTGLTFSGGPVTSSGTITLAGVLAVANGGTGATSQTAAANNIFPSQSGNANRYLTTDGTNVSWSTTPATDIPSGTIMLFMQAAAPTGWTQVTTQNNVAVPIVNTAGGGTGGTIPFTTLFSSTSSYTGSVTITSGQVGDTTLTVAQLASHDHANVFSAGYAESGNAFGWRLWPSDGFTSPTGGSAVHTHSLIGVVAGGNFSSNFAVQYVDVIAASKN